MFSVGSDRVAAGSSSRERSGARRVRVRHLVFLGVALLLLRPEPAAAGEAALRRVFITSVDGTGKLSLWPAALSGTGVAAGDSICQNLANLADFPDPENYRAWLSDSTTDAYCHVQGLTGKRGSCSGGPAVPVGPLYLANGFTNFSGTLDELVGFRPKIYRPILLDEDFEAVLDHRSIWTGTGHDGTVDGSSHCQDWTFEEPGETGATGDPLGTTRAWTNLGSAVCDEQKRLLCIEGGESIKLVNPWLPASLVFVTSTTGGGDLASWADANGEQGIEAGDEICRAHARRGHLPDPDSFFAWLSDDNNDARDRLTAPGPWSRVDHYSVLANPAQLISGAITNAIHVDELGRYPEIAPLVWTGTLGSGLAALLNCENWTTSEIPPSGQYGGSGFSHDDWWTGFGLVNCMSPSALYCFSNRVVVFWDGFEYGGNTSRWSEVVP